MAFLLKSFRHCKLNDIWYPNNFNQLKRCISSVPRISTIYDVYSSQLLGSVHVEGWISGIRKMKELIFLDVVDGSCSRKLQVLTEKNKAPNGLNYGASIRVFGVLQINKNNQLELSSDDVSVLGECNFKEGYPFTQRMPYNPNHEREFIHLRPRTPTFSSLLRIRHKSEIILHNILDSAGFFKVNVPVLTTNDCEGGGEVFTVRPDNIDLLKEMIKESDVKRGAVTTNEDKVFFNEKTYLTVSGQLHLEAAARSLKKVYSLGPTFRAENSKSRLHLSEFYMLETEIAFVNDINNITNLIEFLLKDLIGKILAACSEELISYYKLTNVDYDRHLELLNKIINEKFITVNYDEAYSILDKNRDKFKSRLPKKGESFGKEHELCLVEYCDNLPVFVVEWPSDSKPFYMKSQLDTTNKVEAMDLLCINVGELCGGGVREDNYDILKAKIMNSNFGSKLDWYLQLREFGNVTTGGFGMGFERFLQLLLNIPNIKDTIPFPRWPHNCKL